jgi:hypothetical protein
MKTIIAVVRIVCLIIGVVALALLAACELVLAYPVAWWLYLAVAVVGVAALLRPAPLRQQLPGLCGGVLLLGTIAVLYFVPWTSRKPFLRDLDRVRTGMTESEVRRIMARYREGTGWPANPAAASTNAEATLTVLGTGAPHVTTNSPAGELVLRDSLVFRHSDDGRFNSDWGIVSLSSGRVVRVEFSAD